MTDKEILQAMQEMIQPIREDITSMKSDICGMKSDIDSMKTDIGGMKSDIASLKKTAALVEHDLVPKVQILLENHSDLAKNVMVAKDIEERVGKLEFDVKIIKGVLKAKS